MKKLLLTIVFALGIINAHAVQSEEWVYKTVNGTDLKMAVFLPDNYAASNQNFPCIVYFHGGGWTGGLPSWQFPDCEYWRTRGMIAVSVDYRLQVTYENGIKVPLEPVKDAKSAVRYLRANASQLKVDTNKIICAGSSAGGQLAAATAMINDPSTNDNVYDLSISCVPNALILYNPYYETIDLLNPEKHVVNGLPPTIIYQGENDTTVPYLDMIDYHNSLIAAGNESSLYIAENRGHGFCNGLNEQNRHFYWSLELGDQFLTRNGLITGNSTVTRPDGVNEVTASQYYSFNPVESYPQDPNGSNDNLALNGTATQSTTLNGADASRAIDGDTNGVFSSVNGSVTAAQGPNAWWEVDLGGSYEIDDINVFNRTDNCCKSRLSDFTISVINSGGTTTFTQTITTAPNPSVTIDAGGAVGQVVRIQSNLITTLNLAEVQVFGSESESSKLDQTITFNLPAKQLGDADFDPATASSGYNISYTSSNTSVATIVNGNIRIVGVGTSEITASQAGNVVYNAAPSVTRTLVVTDGNTGGTTNLAYNAPATQSTTLGDAVASRANDGDTNGNFGGDSVSAAGGPNAWWEVDLEGSYSIDDIVIFNRTNNCCKARLSDFTVSVINSSGTTTFTQTITTAPNPSVTIDAGGAIGEVVRIQSNLTETLNLAEVEVYGAGSNTNTNNTITIQENATGFCDVDGVIQSADAGYTGSGYANTSNALGRAIDWEIDGAAGSYTFVWRYLVGSARTADLIVNGTTEASGISFVNTQGSWFTAEATVSLGAGVKSIILSSTSSTGLAKIDYVEVTGPNVAVSGCTNSSKTSSEKTTLDVEASDADGVLYAFPNPVTDIVNIKISGSKGAKLDIMNNLGQHVFTQDLKGSSTAVDLSDLSSGIYILRVTGEKQVQTKKIIKK